MKFENVRPLREIADIQTGPFGSQLHKEDYVENGTPIVTVEHLGNRVFTEQNLPKVSDEDRERLNKYVLKTGDIVFSRVGSVDRCSYVDEEHNGWMFSGRCLRVRATTQIDPLYLYYFFCLESTRDFVRNIAVGATMPSINTKLLGEVPVSIPDLDTQKAIATVLSAIDDKIALNNKINENLEQQAQAVYDLTFISFDGVSNNEFQESEFGMIPKGWTIRQLSDVTKNVRDRVKDNMYEVLSALNTGNLCPSEEYFSKQVFSKNIKNYIVVEPFDFAYNPSRINIGSIGMNDLGYTGCVSPVYVVVRPEKEYQYFLDFFIKSKRFKEEVKARASGSVRQSLSYADFGQIKVIYPPIDVVEKFNGKYAFLLSTMNHYKKEIKILENLRDVLLPKLMNGEIDV